VFPLVKPWASRRKCAKGQWGGVRCGVMIPHGSSASRGRVELGYVAGFVHVRAPLGRFRALGARSRSRLESIRLYSTSRINTTRQTHAPSSPVPARASIHMREPLPSVLVSYLKCYLTHAPRHAPPVHPSLLPLCDGCGHDHGHRRLHSVALPHRVPHSTYGVYLSRQRDGRTVSTTPRCALTSFHPAPPRCSGGHVVTGIATSHVFRGARGLCSSRSAEASPRGAETGAWGSTQSTCHIHARGLRTT
jgi:hypothetical protein